MRELYLIVDLTNSSLGIVEYDVRLLTIYQICFAVGSAGIIDIAK